MNADASNAERFLVQERGIFWWADEKVPPTQFAPDFAIHGDLRISYKGETTIDLDGFLTPGTHPFSALATSDDPLLRTRKIQGLLRTSNKRVLLTDLSRRGCRSATANVSFEGFMALHCLVGDRDFPKQKADLTFRYVDVDLTGFEEWLRLGSIHVERGKVALHAHYHRPKDMDYLLANGKLTIIHDLSGPLFTKTRHDLLALTESVILRFKRDRTVTIEEAEADYRVLQDLFIMLTDSTYNLDWPTTAITDQHHYKLYFYRDANSAAPPRAHECLTNFLQIKDNFGALFSAWRAKRESFGPGFYLYLGTRRGRLLYPEHRFIMLIWGIEAFHRKKYGSKKSTSALRKMERILESIANNKDKKFAKSWLKHSLEPNLEHRIFESLKAIPLGFDEKRLREFAKGCAKDRNDISHFGEHQDGGRTYSEFIIALTRKSDALAYLYHVLILYEIGVNETILRWWVNESFYSFRIKFAFASVGLMDNPIPPAKTEQGS